MEKNFVLENEDLFITKCEDIVKFNAFCGATLEETASAAIRYLNTSNGKDEVGSSSCILEFLGTSVPISATSDLEKVIITWECLRDRNCKGESYIFDLDLNEELQFNSEDSKKNWAIMLEEARYIYMTTSITIARRWAKAMQFEMIKGKDISEVCKKTLLEVLRISGDVSGTYIFGAINFLKSFWKYGDMLPSKVWNA